MEMKGGTHLQKESRIWSVSSSDWFAVHLKMVDNSQKGERGRKEGAERERTCRIIALHAWIGQSHAWAKISNLSEVGPSFWTGSSINANLRSEWLYVENSTWAIVTNCYCFTDISMWGKSLISHPLLALPPWPCPCMKLSSRQRATRIRFYESYPKMGDTKYG